MEVRKGEGQSEVPGATGRVVARVWFLRQLPLQLCIGEMKVADETLFPKVEHEKEGTEEKEEVHRLDVGEEASCRDR